MSSNKLISEIEGLRDEAIADLLAMSDAELRAEAKEDGVDLETCASQTRQAMREAAAAALRQRLSAAKVRAPDKAPEPHRAAAVRPTLDKIKQMVQQLFDREPMVGLAFREGKRQSESDWYSLYDDLVAMGAIKAEDHDH